VEGYGFAGRGAEGAGFTKFVAGFGGGWMGDGAVVGLRGRGIVVVRWVSGADALVGDVVGGLMDVGWGDLSATGVFIGAAGAGLTDATSGCDSGIEVVVGAAGVGCNGAVVGDIVSFTATDAPGSGLSTFADCAFFKVPLTRTSSNILLVVGVTGVACGGVTVGFGASFFGAAFVVFAGVFFSFFGSTGLSFTTALVAAFFAALLFASTAGDVPASSATTFFGRPRFLTAGGSTVASEDIVAPQLAPK
jgi:hypothetical protein